MINAYDFIDIVIRRDALERKEKGLSEKFIQDHKVELPHYDEKLICITGGMNVYDVDMAIKYLEEEYGLVYNDNLKEGPTTDIVVVDLFHWIATDNNWLKCKKHESGDRYKRIYYFEES